MISVDELMKGDWLQNTNGNVGKVIGIQPYNQAPSEIIMSYNGRTCFSDPKLLQPVPITPEILEKNGFDINGIPEDMQPVEERDWSDETYVWSRQETPDESTDVCVYMDDPDNFFVEIIGPDCHVDGVHIKYVHELQNTLRLCKIEKEIVL